MVEEKSFISLFNLLDVSKNQKKLIQITCLWKQAAHNVLRATCNVKCAPRTIHIW